MWVCLSYISHIHTPIITIIWFIHWFISVRLKKHWHFAHYNFFIWSVTVDFSSFSKEMFQNQTFFHFIVLKSDTCIFLTLRIFIKIIKKKFIDFSNNLLLLIKIHAFLLLLYFSLYDICHLWKWQIYYLFIFISHLWILKSKCKFCFYLNICKYFVHFKGTNTVKWTC